MRDTGLEQAISAAGGVASLARALGIAQPSVSAWRRIPADRVAAVEAITKISRNALRPDLFDGPQEAAGMVTAADEIDQLRADEYALLAVLFGRAPSADFLDRLTRLKGDSTEMGLARIALADAATRTNEHAVNREYFDLFVGVGRGEILPYGSYYLTGFLMERPLARVRADLEKLGIERDGARAEPEDHIAILCDVMAGLARGSLAPADADAQTCLELQRDFFDAHIKPWATRMFVDVETAKRAEFYRAAALYGRVFIELEIEAFKLMH